MLAALLLAACASGPPPSATPPPSGELLVLEWLGPPVLSALDPLTGQTETRFEVPSGGFATDLDVSGSEVALAYTAPPSDGGDGYDRSVIVRLLEDGSLQEAACLDAAGVWCLYPAQAGDRVWFAASGPEMTSGADHSVACVDTPGGPVREVAPWGTEPAASADQVAWIAVDPATLARSLVLADVDGVPVRTLVTPEDAADISQPFFSADGAWVYFVVPAPQIASAWDWVVPRAEAHGVHDVVGDWWRAATDGSGLQQVTDLGTVHYDGRAHPDGRWFAAATREGVVWIDLETGEATTALETRTVRALDWGF